MDKKVIITIARQYGSGGKTIGMKLADRLGVEYYNRDIMKLASEDSGISEQLFAQADEHLKTSGLFGIMKKAYHGELIPPESKDFTSNRNLFNYQAKVIQDLADQGTCVIIGRCADYILKDRPDVVRVFVHGSPEYNLRMTIENKAYPNGENPEKYIQRIDKYRAEYYHYYTGQNWIDARNYDLCLNSEKLGFDGCVDAILAYIDIKFKNQ